MTRHPGRPHRPPRRTATRRPSPRTTALHVVPDAPIDVDLPPDELTAAVAGEFIAAVAAARTPLEAEVALCAIFRIVGSQIEGDEEEVARALRGVMTAIVGYAERLATPEALAALRVCASLGPDDVRAAAGASAARVAASGVPDRPWAGRLGAPTVQRAWQYGDVLGAQFSVGVLFTDRGRDHALMVLVDNGLGGGVKDAWIAEGPDATGMRDLIAERMADEPTAFFEDVDVPTAARALQDALANPPCPEQPDQIEDVAGYLFLVRSRAARLIELAGLTG